MENSSRNFITLYAIVALLSIAGVALNVVSMLNLKSLEVSPLTNKEVNNIISKGFLIRAILYLLVALTSLVALLKRVQSKNLLIIIVILLISIFVFGPYIFDFLLGNSTLDAGYKN